MTEFAAAQINVQIKSTPAVKGLLRENSVNVFTVIKVNKENSLLFNFYSNTIIPNSYSVKLVMAF